MLADRVGDVANEPNQELLPIDGYQRKPLVTLEKAVEPLFRLFDEQRLKDKVQTAKARSQHPADGLSIDESAAIMLYTFEEDEREQSFYFVLNHTLRQKDRDLLKPWFLYLKLLLTALHALPPIANQVLRGVKGDFSQEYARLETTVWWGISSCTKGIKPLQSEAFFGYEGKRTLFVINCLAGRCIENHSYYQHEREILLLPGRFFKVIAQMSSGPDVQMIELEECQPAHELCAPTGVSEWRQRQAGLNLEGICRDPSCMAHEQEVIMPVRAPGLNLLAEMKDKARCPMCAKFVRPVRVSFRRCRWKWHGIEEDRPDDPPLACEEDWKSSEVCPMFIIRRPRVRWLQLVFEVEVQ